MKILVVGATGYIGSKILEAARKIVPSQGTTTLGLSSMMRLKLDEPNKFDYKIINPVDAVFLTAAISSPDICSREHARAWAVNVTGTTAFIENVIARGARIVFFSSDTVYGEKEEHFDESAACNPAGEYADMKREVEKRFIGHQQFKAIRLSYVFSREDKFTKYLSGCAERNEEAEIFHPFYRAVIYRDDVVQGAIALAQRWNEFPQTAINFGGPVVISRAEFAQTLKEVTMPTLRFRVTEPEAVFFKNRPRNISMSSPILPVLLGRPPYTLHEAATIEFQAQKNSRHSI